MYKMADYASEILRVYDKMNFKHIKYCAVCLRTEEERRLVRSRAFRKLAESLNIGYRHVETVHVCFICEKHATAALRFQAAVNFALSIRLLYGEMKSKKAYQEDVRMHLNKTKLNKSSKFQFIDHCEQHLKKIRAQTELLQTEILVIDIIGVGMSEMHYNPSEMYAVPDRPPDPEPEPECVPPDAPHPHDSPPETNTPTDTLLVFVDDNDDVVDVKCFPTNINDDETNGRVDISKGEPTQQSHETGLGDDNCDNICVTPESARVPQIELGNEPRALLNRIPDISEYIKKETTEDKSPDSDSDDVVIVSNPPIDNIPRTSSENQTASTRIPEVTAPKLVPIERLLEKRAPASTTSTTDVSSSPASGNEAPSVSRPEAETQNIILYPIMEASNGILLVPTLSAAIINGQLVSNTHVPQVAVPTPPSNTGSMNAGTLASLMIDGTSPMGIPRISIRNDANTIKIVTKSLKGPDRVNASERSVAEENLRTEKARKRLRQELSQRKSKLSRRAPTARARGCPTVKLPLKNTDRIDWEDKIPMDLISFVDSVSPVANGMGVISDVRSLPPEAPSGPLPAAGPSEAPRRAPPPAPRVPVARRSQLDVIDLC